GTQIERADAARDLRGGGTGIEDDRLAIVDQAGGGGGNTLLLGAVLQLLDVERLIGVRHVERAAVGTRECAGRLERRKIRTDGHLRGAETHREGLDRDAPFLAQQLADATPALLDHQTALAPLRHQTGNASSSRKCSKASRSDAPGAATSPNSRSLK